MQAFGQQLPTGVDRIDGALNRPAAIDGGDDRVDVDVAVLDNGVGVAPGARSRTRRCPSEPAGTSVDEVITVSALADFGRQPSELAALTCGPSDVDDTFADFSNFGADIDLIAAGC